MAIMTDLDNAIKDVLDNAKTVLGTHNAPDNFYRKHKVVPIDKLQNLCAEYNIHFREPEEPQLELTQ